MSKSAKINHHYQFYLFLWSILLVAGLLFGSASTSTRTINARAINTYSTVNNHVRNLNRLKLKPGSGRRETIRSKYGPRVTFKTLAFIPNQMGGKNYFVQSFDVDPDGRYAYVGYDHNPTLRRGYGYTKIAKFNLRNHRYHTSRVFRGGHGQSLAYNSVKHTLWLMNDAMGSIKRGNFEEINLRSLTPHKKIHFRLGRGEKLGDSLAFDNRGHLYNADRIWRRSANKAFKNGNIVLYRGSLDHRTVKFNLINQGIRHAPETVIQALAYNSKTKRLYTEFNDAIISVPVNRLGHLRPKDVKETILRQRREYEGLSFDRKGFAYILMNHPKEIMKSTRAFR